MVSTVLKSQCQWESFIVMNVAHTSRAKKADRARISSNTNKAKMNNTKK